MSREDDLFEIICEPGAFAQVQDALAKAGVTPKSGDVIMLPKASVDVDVETGKKIVKLIEMLDDHDDVQNVYSNARI